MLSPLRKTIRGLLTEAVFEAPPATLSKVIEWATKVYAGHVLAYVDAKLQTAQQVAGGSRFDDELAAAEKLLADVKKTRANVERDVDALQAERKEALRYKLYNDRGQVAGLIGVQREDDSYQDTPESDVQPGDVVLLPYLTKVKTYNKRLPPIRPQGRETRGGWRTVPESQWEPYLRRDTVIDEIQRTLDDVIENLEYVVRTRKKEAERHSARSEEQLAAIGDRASEHIDSLTELREELLKYTSKAKVRKSKASTTISVDLSGWKYLPNEQAIVDAWNQGTGRLRRKQEQKWHRKIKKALANFQWAQKNLFGKDPEEVKDLKPPREADGYWDGERYDRSMRYAYGGAPKFEPHIITSATFEKGRGMTGYSHIRLSQLQRELEDLKDAETADDILGGSWREFKLVLDFKGHQRRSGQWSVWDKEMQLDVWWHIPGNIKDWNKALGRLREIARHETQHLGQDALQRIKRLSQEAGLPSHRIMDPGYTVGGEKKSTKADTRREHALRDVEFYTRIADDVDRFMREIELGSYTEQGKANLFRGFLKGQSHSGFFAQLRKAWKEHREIADKRKTKKAKAKAEALAKRYHRRYKKAVTEFVRGVMDRGYDPPGLQAK